MIFTSSSAIRILYFNLPHPSFTLIIFEKPKYVKKLTLIFVKVIFCAKRLICVNCAVFPHFLSCLAKFLMFMFLRLNTETIKAHLVKYGRTKGVTDMKTVLQYLETSALNYPDRPAVSDGESYLTYSQLEEKAKELALSYAV